MLPDQKFLTHIAEFNPRKTKKMAATKLKKRINIMDKIEKDKKK
jgi:D-hexose-6-phosphate mutarotase